MRRIGRSLIKRKLAGEEEIVAIKKGKSRFSSEFFEINVSNLEIRVKRKSCLGRGT